MKTSLLVLTLIAFTPFPVFSQEFGRVPINNRHSSKYRRTMRCYPMADQTFIGFDYGLLNRVFGIKYSGYSPWRFGIPFMLATDVTWRMPRNGNAYFNLELTKRDVARVGRMSLAPKVGYKRIASGFKATDQFYAGLGLHSWHHGVTLGYVRQYQPRVEAQTTGVNGIMLQLYSELLSHLDIRLSAIYWFDQIQYSLAIREQLFQSRFYVSIGYEKINTWRELDVSVAYGF